MKCFFVISLYIENFFIKKSKKVSFLHMWARVFQAPLSAGPGVRLAGWVASGGRIVIEEGRQMSFSDEMRWGLAVIKW